MALFGLTPTDQLTITKPGGQTVHFWPEEPLLYKQSGNLSGMVPTFVLHLARQGIVPAHSVSERFFSADVVPQVFVKVSNDVLKERRSRPCCLPVSRCRVGCTWHGRSGSARKRPWRSSA